MTEFYKISKFIFNNGKLETKHYKSDNFTMYQIASCSKFFTSLVVAIFYQKGILDYDTDINKYLKSWKCPTDNITLRLLLSHTSGSGNHTGYFGFPPQSKVNISNPEIISTNKYAKPYEITYKPGTRSCYSGVGYQVIQQILEDITNMKLHKLMEIYIFKPLNMNNSTGKLLYKNKHNYKLAHMNYKYKMYPDTASSGVWTCINDFIILSIDLLKGINYDKSIILKQSTLQMITTDLHPNWGKDKWQKNHYGLGPQVGTYFNKQYFGHTGNNIGYKMIFRCIPEKNYIKVVLSNHNPDIHTTHNTADKFISNYASSS